jgi:MFS family permease
VIVLGLVLMLGTIERDIITFLIQPIKRDFGLSDLELSVLIGAAPAIFYACIGLPLARLVDSVRRNTLLSIALGAGGLATSLAGLTQQFWQFAVCRMAVGGGGAVSSPGTYSLLADYFPRERLTRAIAVLTVGLIVGRSLAPVVAGALVALAGTWGAVHIAGLLVREWQMVFVMAGALGVIGSLLMLTVKEPARRGKISASGKRLPLSAVFQYVWQKRALYLPMFLALALFAVESLGIELWRIEFLRRTYGWAPQTAGPIVGASSLISSLIGLSVGTRVSEWLAKAHDDANLRTVWMCLLALPVFATLAPLMPTAWHSIACSSVTAILGMGLTAPLNAALQSVTPNEMRGQITAIYYLIFYVIGMGLGPTVMGFITDVVIGDESRIRYAMALCAGLMTPLAAICAWRGLKPYGREIRDIKAKESILIEGAP